MLKLRPIVVNDDMIVLGGNMRLKACKEAGLKEVPIIKASNLTEQQQKEFIIKDNVGFGEWDWEQLSNEVSKHYSENGFNMNLTTTTPALVGGLSRNDKWSLVRANRVKNTRDKNNQKYYGKKEHKQLGTSSNRITYSFNFKK